MGALKSSLVDGGDFLFLVGEILKIGCFIWSELFGFSLCLVEGFLEELILFVKFLKFHGELGILVITFLQLPSELYTLVSKELNNLPKIKPLL